jgi:cytochrome c biogenesis protein CcmG/thiol:disulfide interchange protein DsbE
VYGAPESFLIDKQGVIRYKHVGAITPELWQAELGPLVKRLEAES